MYLDVVKPSKMSYHTRHLPLHIRVGTAQMEGFHNLSRPEYRHRPPAMSNVLVHLQDWVNREKKDGELLHFTDGGN